MEVRKDDGSEYEPDTLTSIHRGIARKLEESGYGYSLIKSDEFKMSKKVLDARRRELKQSGRGNHPNRAEALTPEHENRLWEVGQLSMSTPSQLMKVKNHY